MICWKWPEEELGVPFATRGAERVRHSCAVSLFQPSLSVPAAPAVLGGVLPAVAPSFPVCGFRSAHWDVSPVLILTWEAGEEEDADGM